MVAEVVVEVVGVTEAVEVEDMATGGEEVAAERGQYQTSPPTQLLSEISPTTLFKGT